MDDDLKIHIQQVFNEEFYRRNAEVALERARVLPYKLWIFREVTLFFVVFACLVAGARAGLFNPIVFTLFMIFMTLTTLAVIVTLVEFIKPKKS